jgi:hypothetical protein
MALRCFTLLAFRKILTGGKSYGFGDGVLLGRNFKPE